jgi:hypothetical protein
MAIEIDWTTILLIIVVIVIAAVVGALIGRALKR